MSHPREAPEGAATLGVLGGLGPESTIEYYRLLVSGYRQRTGRGSPKVLIHSMDVDVVLALAAAEDREGLVAYLHAGLVPLARAGANFALIAVNTPHMVFDELSRASPIPLLSIVLAARACAEVRGYQRVGLFGTRATMRTGFYQQAFQERGITVVLPAEEEQAYVHGRYVTELVAGRFLSDTRDRLIAIARRMHLEEGIQALVLGGTELPLLLRDSEAAGVPLLDTTQIHVDAALDRLCAANGR